jgi:hypothetical protein
VVVDLRHSPRTPAKHRPFALLAIIAALPGIAYIAAPRLRADEPNLKEVVHRMSAYVHAYGEKASIVVATERYTQRVTGGRRTRPEDRITVADFAIVKAEGLGGWVGFRDVVEADGAPISDHQDRLIQILTAASGRLDEAQRLSNESARFNIGPIQRNFNVPTAVLFFFTPESLDRFKFARKGAGRDGTWKIDFRETSRPTLIRTPMGVSVPTDGSVWVDVDTGTVVRTHVHMTLVGAPSPGEPPVSGSAEVDVTYRRIAALDMWLPETMTETYEGARGRYGPERVNAEATYSNYRQFQTAVRIK